MKTTRKVIAIIVVFGLLQLNILVAANTSPIDYTKSLDNISSNSSSNSNTSISGVSTEENKKIPLPQQESSAITKTNENEQSNIIDEVKDKWEECVRQYQTEDGSYIAASYAGPVNYFKDGQWIEIDNTLTPRIDVNLGEVYQNESNSFRATFPKTYNSGGFAKMEKDNYSIAWSLDSVKNSGMKSSEAEVINYSQAADIRDNEKVMDVGKSNSSVLYKAVLADIDLLYTVSPEKIKEDIILNKPSNINSFIFSINTFGLKAIINDDKTISFINSDKSDEVIFNIPTPYMTDSSENQELSHDVKMDLTETDVGYKLVITPNSDWINAPERVFPIFIDPTVSSSQVQTNIIDTFVHLGDLAGEHRVDDKLVVGKMSGQYCKSFIQTLVPPLPSVDVTDARLNLSITYGTSSTQNINISRVDEAWSSSTMCWDTHNNTDRTLVKSNIAATSYSNSPSSLRYSCDVTSTIEDINDGVRSNFGFMVEYTNAGALDYNRFYSSDYTTSTVRPTLVITYTYIETPGITNYGVYYIKNKNSGQYMDVAGADVSDGTTVVQWPYAGTINQQWKVYYMADGTYKLHPMNTQSKYLQVESNNNNDGTDIDISSAISGSNQYWYLMKNPNSTSYRILSKCSNYSKGATVEEASSSNGANIFQYTYTTGEDDNDDWYFFKEEVSAIDTYFLKNVSSNLYADVYGNELDDGAQIKQYSKTTQSNQIWRIERQESGYYKIYPMHTNDRVMSLNTSNNIVSVANATNDRTLWQIEKISGNTFKIRSKQDLTKYITVANNSSTTNLTGSIYNSTSSQWVIEEYDNNSYWGGECMNTTTPTNAYFTATTNAIDSIMTDSIYDDGEYWNVISSVVNMKYVSPGNDTNGRDLMVTYRVSPYTVYEFSGAVTLPIINGVQRTIYNRTDEEFFSGDWDGSSIYICMPTMVGISDDMRKEIVVHELGHALKLSHNREDIDSNNNSWQPVYKATFPSIMHTTCSTVSGTSYSQAEEHISSWTLTNFDKSALRSKWGK